jgi:transposase
MGPVDESGQKRPTGRPKEPVPQDVARRILRMRAEGDSLRAICRKLKLSRSTVEDWITEDRDGFGGQYARAREVGLENEADEIKEIADQKPADAVEAQWQKTRIDARKWRLSKKLPKKYGDKVGVEHSGGVSIQLDTGIRRDGDECASS